MATTKRPQIDLNSLAAKAAELVRERLGMLPNVLSERSKKLRPRISGAQGVPSVCPYCAVGCGTLVYHRDGQIIDIEGNPESPINGGTLCPKGAATYQLHVNPNRWTTCKYRAPYSPEWEDVTLEWALERVAARFKESRDRTFVTTDDQGRALNRTTAIGSLGGATLDNEENYLMAKLFRSAGMPFVENQARI